MRKNQNKGLKKRWSTKEVMHQIYEKHFWGGKEYDFYSGAGSHLPKIIQPYIQIVSNFLKSFEEPLNVCDLGCGDFNVGKDLVPFTKKYIGVDIVADLIQRNKEKYYQENLEFMTLDICKDALPDADCFLVRQVLQHLSNAEILEFVSKLKKRKYIILTEHLPINAFVPNLDMVTSMGNRLKHNSGVVLTEPPFDFEPKSQEVLLRVLIDEKSVIQTILYQNF